MKRKTLTASILTALALAIPVGSAFADAPPL